MIMGGITLLLRPFNLINTILLARVLDPADFGIVSLVMLMLTSSRIFSGLGLGMAVIQSPKPAKQIAFPAFLFATISGIILTLLVALNADALGDWLGSPSVVYILRPMSIIILMETWSLIPDALLQKELQFGRLGIIDVVGELSMFIVALALAYTGFGVWSLALGNFARSAVRFLLFWVLCPGWSWLRPYNWDWQVNRALLRFGLQSASSRFLAYVHSNWDDWLVGRVLGATALGFYSKAYDLTNKTINSLSQSVIGSVFYPSYAKLQDDHPRLTNVYLKSLQSVLLLMVPTSLGFFIIAPEFVSALLGQKWLPMIPALQIYAFMVLTRPVSMNSAPLFSAVGRPNYNLKAGALLLAVMIPSALLLLDQGITGVAFAVAISHLVGSIYNVYQVNSILPGSAKVTAQLTARYISAALVMVAAIYFAKPLALALAGGQSNLLSLLFLILLGALVYIAIVLPTNWEFVKELYQTFRGMSFRRKRFKAVSA